MLSPVEIRSEVRRLRRATPFRPFLLCLEDGTRLNIEGPENIALDATSEDAHSGLGFAVVNSTTRHLGSFRSVMSVVMASHDLY